VKINRTRDIQTTSTSIRYDQFVLKDRCNKCTRNGKYFYNTRSRNTVRITKPPLITAAACGCYPEDGRTILLVIQRVITAVYARQWSRDADKVRHRWLGTLIAFSVTIRGNLTGLPMARIDVYRVYLRSNEYIDTFLSTIWHTVCHRSRFPLIINRCEIEIGLFATIVLDVL